MALSLGARPSERWCQVYRATFLGRPAKHSCLKASRNWQIFQKVYGAGWDSTNHRYSGHLQLPTNQPTTHTRARTLCWAPRASKHVKTMIGTHFQFSIAKPERVLILFLHIGEALRSPVESSVGLPVSKAVALCKWKASLVSGSGAG